ncbi:hypothetical protein VPNG_07703 [Cytospora leucostoma]|uniref:Uncharacterized protein n=1 Tax=Cytospora leucostoma TaxID=1230097 RepID=A0A423W882_9PEZI|nr:hypothetical protein VPNG_07703 [Cytospora leucostoma]
MKRSGRRPGPGAASTGVPPNPATLANLSSLGFLSSTHLRSRPDPGKGGPATTGGVATFANGATFGDPFQTEGDNSSTIYKTSSRQSRREQHQKQQSPTGFRGLRRRANSTYSLRDRNGVDLNTLGIDTYDIAQNGASSNRESVVIDNGQPPALPEFALTSAAKHSRDADVFASQPSTAKSSLDAARGYLHAPNTKMMARSGSTPLNGFSTAGVMIVPTPPGAVSQGESKMLYQHIQEMANKRISTLEYLRKAHEGRVYWFNTLLFDKPDLSRMPFFEPRRLARRATNYLLLGLSLPTVIDLNASSPLDFLRHLNILLTEFDSFQQLHGDASGPTSTLSRARIPQMFRRATPSSKARRGSSANNETLYEGAEGGPGSANGGSMSGPSSSAAGLTVGNALGGSASVVNFGQCEADLQAGEVYVHLLTPSLPFDPDFFETFATLCDVLIDAYSRLLSLLSTPRDCNAAVAELFTKADARIRKIIVQGIVKEFEDSSRTGVKSEVANVGKIVIGGLM